MVSRTAGTVDNRASEKNASSTLEEEMHDVSDMDRVGIGGRDGSDGRVRTGFGLGPADPKS